MTMKRLVTGLLKTRAEAEAAVRRILDDGHVRDDISLMMSAKAANHRLGANPSRNTPSVTHINPIIINRRIVRT